MRSVDGKAPRPHNRQAGGGLVTPEGLRVLRSALLAHLASGLWSDNRVQAVALVGSIGRGDEDDWSDIDLMILMDAEQVARFAERPADTGWARAPLLVDSRQNAPAGCAQINAVHLLDGLPFWVDFCVFPARETSWPVGHRSIFEREPVSVSDQTFDSLTAREPRRRPAARTPEDERRVHLAFVPLAAKYIARGQPEHVRDMIRFIGAAPDYHDLHAHHQLRMLRMITRSLSEPAEQWLSTAVMSYLDLVERSALTQM